MRLRIFALVGAALLLVAKSPASAAEQQDQNAGTTVQAPQTAPQPANSQRHHLIELSSKNWHPLKPSEKFSLFSRDLISWETHLSLGIGAGIAYATDSRDYLGTGMQGYGKRYGINFLDEANGTFFMAYLLPVLFHEDPRYIPFDNGTTRQRAVYAVESMFMTRSDYGGFTMNKSRLLGEVISAALSTAYDYPPGRTRRLGDTFTRAGVNIGSEAAFNLFKEFWPDFARKMKLNVWLRNLVRSSIRDAIRVD